MLKGNLRFPIAFIALNHHNLWNNLEQPKGGSKAIKKAEPHPIVSLEDKYTASEGSVFMNGTQALVRLPLVQMQRDRQAGLNTATYISGYRGSPMGSYDFALEQSQQLLEENSIIFQPGVNEDLAATAIWGTQQIETTRQATKDGVVGIWYGKGPGVDRSGDVFRHANSAGTSKFGGVLAIAGDDHHAKSSTVAHQSDFGFISALMPMLYPSSIHEFVELGLLGIAMSRYSGLWCGYKVVSNTAETTGVVDLKSEQQEILLPTDFEFPDGGLNLRWPDGILDQDERLAIKNNAALAFAKTNKIDQLIFNSKKPRFGIVSSGNAYENVREALRQLGIDEQQAEKIGLRLYKVRMPFPLEPEGIRNFAQGLDEILVIEERREIIENQVKQQLYHWPANERPRIVGKFDDSGAQIFKPNEEITTGTALRAISTRLLELDLPDGLAARMKQKLGYFDERLQIRQNHEAAVTRTAHFCSGCPHNISTKVPDGSRAMAGIGCHFMSVWMDRNTETFTHMGGEGASWNGLSNFTDEDHVFVNIGDGTYFHSGYMAIRAAVAAKSNVTYKILFNDAVAMTGGQTHDGDLNPVAISHQLKAEGVKEIWLVSNDPKRYSSSDLAKGTKVKSRKYIDEVQRHLRQVKGCTAIIYDQTCAAELRRRRRRGLIEDPAKNAIINPLVCEGCGDCSNQSNCISIEPLETEFGRKRKINQSTCNKDFSCVEGFCPAFVTVHDGKLKKPELPQLDISQIPQPEIPKIDDVFEVAITGIGGTGVLTIGAILGMAAHLDDHAALMLDVAGLAQKGGAVLSHVRIAATPDRVTTPQIVTGEANLLLATDTVVAGAKETIVLLNPENTSGVLNTHLNPVSNFIFDRDYDFKEEQLINSIKEHIKPKPYQLDFTKLAELVCGNSIATNIMMVGYALQQGLLPISAEAVYQAIEINGVAIDANKTAFNWGRYFAAFPKSADEMMQKAAPALEVTDDFQTMLDTRIAFLKAYQNETYAQKYTAFIAKVQAAEEPLDKNLGLSQAVAKGLFKLMAYKDEYEVARLYTDGTFKKQVTDTFEGDFKIKYHLAPPLLGWFNRSNGRPGKYEFGGWIIPMFAILAKFKSLRGTALDIFGYTRERKLERELISDYKLLIDNMLSNLNDKNYSCALAIARSVGDIRGFGDVKLKSIDKVKSRWEGLQAQFQEGPFEKNPKKSVEATQA